MIKGPIRASPMPLMLVVEGETASPSEPVLSTWRTMRREGLSQPMLTNHVHRVTAQQTLTNDSKNFQHRSILAVVK